MRSKLLLLINNPNLIINFFKNRKWLYINKFLTIVKRIKRLHIFIIKKIYACLPIEIKDFLKTSIFMQNMQRKLGFIKKEGPRVFLKSGISIEAFFLELNKRNCQYVILRWWEDLPIIEADEDIDILILDADRNKILDLLGTDQRCQKLDIYTVYGTKNGAYNDIPYLKLNLAEDMLINRVLYKENFFVPSDEYYFYSLVYHALFHKGSHSGIKGFEITSNQKPEHDYSMILKVLAKKAKIDISIELDCIVQLLQSKGYYPSYDLLMKMIDYNKSIKSFIPALKSDINGGELGLIIIREKAIQENLLQKFKEVIEVEFNINILKEIILTEKEKRILSREMRGATWGNGPYPMSGGLPSVVFVVYDYNPQPLDKTLMKLYPWFTNIHFLYCKKKMRNLIFNTRSMYRHYNAVHSTDHEAEAKYFLKKILSQEEYSFLTQKIGKIREEYKTKYKVYKILSLGQRSKVELIQFKNNLAIKKTFKEGEKRFLSREIYASEILSQDNKYIVELLKKEKSFLITKYYNNKLELLTEKEKEVQLLKCKRELIDILKKLYDSNYAHINLTIDNIIMTEDNELKIIDFEFLYKYKEKPKSFKKSYDIVGTPLNYQEDLPMGYNSKNIPFNKRISQIIYKTL